MDLYTFGAWLLMSGGIMVNPLLLLGIAHPETCDRWMALTSKVMN